MATDIRNQAERGPGSWATFWTVVAVVIVVALGYVGYITYWQGGQDSQENSSATTTDMNMTTGPSTTGTAR